MSIYAFFNEKRFWPLRHILFWLFMYLDEFLGFMGITESLDFMHFIFPFLLDVWVVYFNLYFLIPKYFENGKIVTYIFFTGLSILVNVGFLLYSTSITCPECLDFYEFFMVSLLTLSVLGVALTIKISKLTYEKQRKLMSLQKVQMTNEINYLRKQINPHFLFNVLNNIYVQSKESPKEVPNSIMQLSELMRYQTYQANQDQVSLTQEIEFLKQYLELEKLRKENLEVHIEENGNLRDIQLAPMLFLPFIENACKHSTRIYNEREQIFVSWSRMEENLTFTIQNTMGHKYQIVEGENMGGFGLDNIKKRLELLYPNQYDLDIQETEDMFKVKLELSLPRS